MKRNEGLVAKRIFDLLMTLALASIFFPIATIAAICVVIFHRENPLFTQERIGFNGRPFRILKIRTFFGPNNTVSPLGRFLRRSNIDEIPQLINILKGEMSLVGPRPELTTLNENFSEAALSRYMVPPGLTGFWQLSPHRMEPIHKHEEYDLQYVRTRSLFVDLMVILRTPFYAFHNNHEK